MTHPFHRVGDLFATHDRSPRGLAVAGTLHEVADIPQIAGMPLTIGDLAAAFRLLGQPQDGDTPPMVARRATCRQLHEATVDVVDGRGDHGRAAAVWAAIGEHFPGDDGRAVAIRATWAREAAELTAAC